MDLKEMIARLKECQARPANVGCEGCSMHKDGGDCELYHGEIDLLITRALNGLTDADALIAGLMTERDEMGKKLRYAGEQLTTAAAKHGALSEAVDNLRKELDASVALNATLREEHDCKHAEWHEERAALIRQRDELQDALQQEKELARYHNERAEKLRDETIDAEKEHERDRADWLKERTKLAKTVEAMADELHTKQERIEELERAKAFLADMADKAVDKLEAANKGEADASAMTNLQRLLRDGLAERLRDPHTRIDYTIDGEGSESLEVYTDFYSA